METQAPILTPAVAAQSKRRRRCSKVELECGFKPFLKSSRPGLQIQPPAFFRQGSRRISKAIRKTFGCEPESKKYYRAEKQLQEMISLYNEQRRKFYRHVAEDICERFLCVKFKDPKLSSLRQKHGAIIADYDFPQFLRIMKSTASKRGIILEIENDPTVLQE